MGRRKQKNIDEMSFLDHLEELRWVLVRCSFGILITSIVAGYFSDFIFDDVIFGPMKGDFVTYEFFCDLAQKYNLDKSFCNTKLDFDVQNTEVEGQLSLYIWTCITAGFILGFPYILVQFWNFIKPALHKKEKSNVTKFVFFSSLLFFLGILFGYFIITPLSLNFSTNFKVSKESQIINHIIVDSYIGKVKSMVLATGIVFELPVIIYFLSNLGLVTPKFLSEYRRYAYVILLIIAAIVTPPDVVSQIIVTIPLVILYEISIFISGFVIKKSKINESS